MRLLVKDMGSSFGTSGVSFSLTNLMAGYYASDKLNIENYRAIGHTCHKGLKFSVRSQCVFNTLEKRQGNNF